MGAPAAPTQPSLPLPTWPGSRAGGVEQGPIRQHHTQVKHVGLHGAVAYHVSAQSTRGCHATQRGVCPVVCRQGTGMVWVAGLGTGPWCTPGTVALAPPWVPHCAPGIMVPRRETNTPRDHGPHGTPSPMTTPATPLGLRHPWPHGHTQHPQCSQHAQPHRCPPHTSGATTPSPGAPLVARWCPRYRRGTRARCHAGGC